MIDFGRKKATMPGIWAEVYVVGNCWWGDLPIQ